MYNKDFSFVRFLLTFVILFGVLTFAGSKISMQIGRKLLAEANEADYLESMRNQTRFGCVTMMAREPEILLIGNSASYAAWDMRRLQKLTGLRVGGCMMGGATEEVMAQIAKMALDLKKPPKYIILGASPYMFLRSENYMQQLENIKNLLDEAHWPYAFWLNVFRNKQLLMKNYVFLAKDQDEKVRYHEPQLEAREDFIESYIHHHVPPDIEQVKKAQTAPRIPDFGKRSASKVCSSVEKMGAKFFVINIPASPLAEELYSEDLANYYTKALSQYAPCAEKIINFKANYYGWENKHFVNRLMGNVKYDEWKFDEQVQFDFDPDHVNPIGARLFTEKAVCLIFGGGANKNTNEASAVCR